MVRRGSGVRVPASALTDDLQVRQRAFLPEGALLTKASEEADIPSEHVPMKHPLVLARSADRDVELLNATGVLRRRRDCTAGRSEQQSGNYERSCCEAGHRSMRLHDFRNAF